MVVNSGGPPRTQALVQISQRGERSGVHVEQRFEDVDRVSIPRPETWSARPTAGWPLS